MEAETGYKIYYCNLMKNTGILSAICSEDVYRGTNTGREALLEHIIIYCAPPKTT